MGTTTPRGHGTTFQDDPRQRVLAAVGQGLLDGGPIEHPEDVSPRRYPAPCLFLLLLPALWPDGSAGGSAVFAFVVWALLIVAVAVLAPGLARPETDDRAPPDEEG